MGDLSQVFREIRCSISEFTSILSREVTQMNQSLGISDERLDTSSSVLPMPGAYQGVPFHDASARTQGTTLDVPGDPETRRWLARELHDTVGTTLATMLLEMEFLKRREGASSLTPELESLQTTTRGVLSSVRSLLSGLRDEPAQITGFADTVFESLSRFERTTGTQTTLVTEEGWPIRIDGRAAHHLLRIVEEALRNVRRHSEARSVEITLERAGDQAVLSVRDDGRGLETAPNGQGYGLTGMHEYAVLAGADLTIESFPERGTTIRVHLPLEKL